MGFFNSLSSLYANEYVIYWENIEIIDMVTNITNASTFLN